MMRVCVVKEVWAWCREVESKFRFPQNALIIINDIKILHTGITYYNAKHKTQFKHNKIT